MVAQVGVLFPRDSFVALLGSAAVVCRCPASPTPCRGMEVRSVRGVQLQVGTAPGKDAVGRVRAFLVLWLGNAPSRVTSLHTTCSGTAWRAFVEGVPVLFRRTMPHRSKGPPTVVWPTGHTVSLSRSFPQALLFVTTLESAMLHISGSKLVQTVPDLPFLSFGPARLHARKMWNG